jgi:hypothetical protein
MWGALYVNATIQANRYRYAMSFPKPIYGRHTVDQAGAFLSSREHPMTSENITNLVKSYDVVNNWRSSHSYPINTFQITLRRKVKDVCGNAIIAQRLKRYSSIIKKLQLLKKHASVSDAGYRRTPRSRPDR